MHELARGDLIRTLDGRGWWVWTGSQWSALQGVERFIVAKVVDELRFQISWKEGGLL